MLRTMVAAAMLVFGVALPALAGPGSAALTVVGALCGLLLAIAAVLGAAMLAPVRWLRGRLLRLEDRSPPL